MYKLTEYENLWEYVELEIQHGLILSSGDLCHRQYRLSANAISGILPNDVSA